VSRKETDSADAGEAAVEERIGYGRPPLATRFRPGQSGNPRGRAKGSRNLSTIVNAALNEPVIVTENGRRRSITKLEAAIKQLVNRAAAGEARATRQAIELAQANESRTAEPDVERIDEADAIVMAELQRRLGRQP
jgi:Family of unknown function (DUF5681)